jgi:hypothetical protein
MSSPIRLLSFAHAVGNHPFAEAIGGSDRCGFVRAMPKSRKDIAKLRELAIEFRRIAGKYAHIDPPFAKRLNEVAVETRGRGC